MLEAAVGSRSEGVWERIATGEVEVRDRPSDLVPSELRHGDRGCLPVGSLQPFQSRCRVIEPLPRL